MATENNTLNISPVVEEATLKISTVESNTIEISPVVDKSTLKI